MKGAGAREDEAWAGVRANTEAFFLLPSVSRRSGGLTRAVLRRVRLLDAHGIRTTVLVLRYAHGEDLERLLLRLQRVLPWRTRVRYFWREGGTVFPGDLREVPRPPARPSGGRTVRDALGRVRQVEAVDDEGRRIVQLRSLGGRVVAVDTTDDDGTILRHHVADGRTWASVREPHRLLHAEAVLATHDGPWRTTLAAGHGRWVQHVLEGTDRLPVLFVDGTATCLVPTTMRPGRARVVSTLHNPHTVEPWTARDPAEPHWDAVLRRTGAITRVVVLTEAQRRDVLERYGPPPPTVVPNAVPTGRPAPAERAPDLVVIGRLTRQKRVDHAIRVFAQIASGTPAARLHIVGDGPRRASLVALADGLGIADKVVLHGFQRDVGPFLARASALVLSSRHEGMPLVLLEAMNAGTPCIAYDVSYGPSEVIRDGIDGLLVRAGDIAGLADAMSSVLTDSELQSRLGAAACAVSERFAGTRHDEGWLQVYLEEVRAAESFLEADGSPA